MLNDQLATVIKRAIGFALKGGAADYPEGQEFHPAACLADAAIEVGGFELRDDLQSSIQLVALATSTVDEPIIDFTQEQCVQKLRKMLAVAQETHS